MTIADLPARATTPPAHRVRFVEVCGHRLEYADIPAHQLDRPTLLFLHEGLGSVSMWRDFPARLAAHTGCRTVVYSRYGHGRSSARRAPYAVDFMHVEALEVLPALRAALAIDRPVLVGHSTGASMALIHAGAGRFGVEGVVAMAPLCFVEEFNLASIRGMRDVYATTDLRERLARHHDDADAVFRGWNDIWLNPDFKAWSIEDCLPGIRCPVLAILGEDDEYSTPAQIELIARRAVGAPDVELLRLADCRHSPHKDQPAAVIDAVSAFIERIRG
jgi:pimeloyl-ACP methyl ester carboxylesterase